jgi:hypothetical protein
MEVVAAISDSLDRGHLVGAGHFAGLQCQPRVCANGDWEDIERCGQIVGLNWDSAPDVPWVSTRSRVYRY